MIKNNCCSKCKNNFKNKNILNKLNGGGNCKCMKKSNLFFKFKGGGTNYTENDIPINIPSYNTNYYNNIDVARNSISARFQGGKRKNTRKYKSYKNKTRKNKTRNSKKNKKINGGGWFSPFYVGFTDPLGGGGNDILSASGTSGGAALSAKIFSGAPVEDSNSTRLFNIAGTKPLV